MLKNNLDYNDSVTPNTEFLHNLQTKLPEYFTKDGEFDFAKFQENLRKNNISDELTSGYRLDFIGKNYAKKQAGERPTTVIVPDTAHNNRPENAQSNNLFFTGDNLEVLRHLQASYQDAIDFIYIDPPYNTGSDGFVYPDSFAYTDTQLKDMFGLDDDGLKRLKSIQGKASHSAWLTFMYPRLYLAKKLLKDTGVIFVSIDDNEQANLKLLMDEVFGEGSFNADIIWKMNPGGRDYGGIALQHEYILAYSKTYQDLYPILDKDKKFPMIDELGGFEPRELRNRNVRFNIDNRPNLVYPFYVNTNSKDENGLYDVSLDKIEGWVEVYPLKSQGIQTVWRWGKPKSLENLNINVKAKLKTDGSFMIVQKYRSSYKNERTIIDSTDVRNESGTAEIKSLFNGTTPFDYPKNTNLLKRLIQIGSDNKDATILDFFAGSSTTADAVMQLNADDGGNRQFIMATLPEPTYTVNADGKEVPTKGGEAAFNAGFRSIDAISRERIIRAAKKIKTKNTNLPDTFDAGFKHYRVTSATVETLEKLEYSDNMQTDLFSDMIEPFSASALTKAHRQTAPKEDFPWHGYDFGEEATGTETILTTWLIDDGYRFDVTRKTVDFAGYSATYVDDTRVYIIDEGWSAGNTKSLVNQIGTHELSVQTVVVYGYSLTTESLRELEIALQQLDVSVKLVVRY